jgi:hypothetical protein
LCVWLSRLGGQIKPMPCAQQRTRNSGSYSVSTFPETGHPSVPKGGVCARECVWRGGFKRKSKRICGVNPRLPFSGGVAISSVLIFRNRIISRPYVVARMPQIAAGAKIRYMFPIGNFAKPRI